MGGWEDARVRGCEGRVPGSRLRVAGLRVVLGVQSRASIGEGWRLRRKERTSGANLTRIVVRVSLLPPSATVCAVTRAGKSPAKKMPHSFIFLAGDFQNGKSPASKIPHFFSKSG